MKPLLELVGDARTSGDFAPLIQAIPFANFLGFSIEQRDGVLIGKMAYAERLIGNAMIPALHGGTIGGLLESTAVFSVLLRGETLQVPKTISITIDYLRTGRPLDTYAKAEIVKLGRRVASIRASAWQDDPNKLIAEAGVHLLLTTP